MEEAKQTGVNDDNSIKLKEDEIDAILNGGSAETQNQTNTKPQAQAPAAATAAGETEDVEVFRQYKRNTGSRYSRQKGDSFRIILSAFK